MSHRSLPKSATHTFCRALLLATLTTALASIAEAQTPAVSPVLAFSGSRVPDGVILGPDGALYGATVSSSSVTGGLIFRATTDGSSVETVYQFGSQDGVGPAGALLLGSDGQLYGTAQFSNGGISVGGGTVFRVAPNGTGFTTLHSFGPSTSNNVNSNPINTDGASPHGALIEGSDGFLYGVARFGGPAGAGTVYKVGKDGSGFTLLHAFAAITSSSAVIVNADGAHPRAKLVESAGFFYGTTNVGGAHGQGTIFRLAFDGSAFELLHEFTTPTAPSGSTVAVNQDGALPQAGLTDGGDGLLYGTTVVGGANGGGVLYSITPDGSVMTALHNFVGESGTEPVGTLLLASDGRLYGTTSAGGTTASGGASTLGTVFSIARDGTGFTNLHNFDGTTGSNGNGTMVQLNATEFIGTATNGGRCGSGTIFRLSLAGTTVNGDTTCGSDSGGGGGGGATSVELLLMLAAPLLAAAIRRSRRVAVIRPKGGLRTRPCRRAPWRATAPA
jgi:uncharacterized repeat protein (TIGR03803 family)